MSATVFVPLSRKAEGEAHPITVLGTDAEDKRSAAATLCSGCLRFGRGCAGRNPHVWGSGNGVPAVALLQ